MGKSFDVDDGFLKKVRVAQFAPGRTRVVLEVDNLSDYDAFLLPNPYRLIIDIHGKNWNGRQRREAAESLMTQNSPHGAAAVEATPIEFHETKSMPWLHPSRRPRLIRNPKQKQHRSEAGATSGLEVRKRPPPW